MDIADPSLREVPAQAERLAREAEPLIVRLRQVGAQMGHAYDDPDRMAGLQGQRDELRARMLELVGELHGLDRKMRVIAAQQEVETWVGVFTGDKSAGEFKKMVDAREIAKDAGRKKGDLGEALAQDDLDYKLHLDEFRKRQEARERARVLRRMTWALLAVLLLVGALGGGFYVLWRGQKRLTQMTQGGTAPPVRAPTGPISVADVIGGNYRVERELGRGAMGIVYEALDLTLQRRVAVKKMREELRSSPKDLEMFLSEARLVAGLKHPNIVEIHNIIKESGEIYLVFEYVDGKPLGDILQEVPRLQLLAAKSHLRQIAAALDYAHGQRLIHRDLKPANIMVRQDGSVKVMDFGIAHQASKTVARMTRAASWGTPPYMAPEQELGQVSRESDLYALAVCFYEMATGRLPFEGPNYLEQKKALRYDPPSRAAPGLSASLDAVLARALAVDPQGRFHSGAELVAALDGALELRA